MTKDNPETKRVNKSMAGVEIAIGAELQVLHLSPSQTQVLTVATVVHPADSEVIPQEKTVPVKKECVI